MILYLCVVLCSVHAVVRIRGPHNSVTSPSPPQHHSITSLCVCRRSFTCSPQNPFSSSPRSPDSSPRTPKERGHGWRNKLSGANSEASKASCLTPEVSLMASPNSTQLSSAVNTANVAVFFCLHSHLVAAPSLSLFRSCSHLLCTLSLSHSLSARSLPISLSVLVSLSLRVLLLPG